MSNTHTTDCIFMNILKKSYFYISQIDFHERVCLFIYVHILKFVIIQELVLWYPLIDNYINILGSHTLKPNWDSEMTSKDIRMTSKLIIETSVSWLTK